MNELNMFLSLGLIHLLGVMSPGPDFLVVTKNTLSKGFKSGLLTSFGIALGNVVHILYSIFGIKLVATYIPDLFIFIQYAGAAYLGYIGLKCIRGAIKAKDSYHIDASEKVDVSNIQAFKIGFVTCLLNGKASLYFVSIFSQFFGPKTDGTTLLLASIFMTIIAFSWFTTWSRIVAIKKVRHFYERHEVKIEIAMGLFFLALCFKMIF